eukprot:CAMPEP_0181320354 /NCGR_PEP_ID=MMETSP1101-20121128/18082_1 /TAXON_ID=46948 /ORGANISM="Rhodomonas abbreviata, Strain Caron Lab Isolate" /LENGTH=71 /DNA_ID=CAMNT_0023428059 /DNA_START=131 /DNA_END=346 /DNA_ORIENTATION=+
MSTERKKTGRELWLEEEEMKKNGLFEPEQKKSGREMRKEERNNGEGVPPLVMGTDPMCKIGGCGYFSDDGK